MAVSEVIPVFPSVESLCDPVKGRPKSSVKSCVKKVYHCPVETCKYFHEDHHFEKLKFLRQHFIKVHKTKTFSCDKCGVQFSLESTLCRHKLICGISYQCYCSAEYKSYEALLTHFKRKHNENASLKYRDMMWLLKAHSNAQNCQNSIDNVVDVKVVVMKNLSRQKLLVLKKNENKTALSKETQTGMKMCKILPNVHQQSELTEDQQLKRTVSIQTISEFVPKKRKRSKIYNRNKISCSANNKTVSFSTSSTQTTPFKDTRSAIFPFIEPKYEIYPKTLPNDFPCESSNEQFKCVELEKSNDEVSLGAVSQPSNLEDNFEGSNVTSQFAKKRMISTEDPNLGYTSCCNVDENSICLEESTTNANSLEALMNDLIKTDVNLIMCSDSETQTPFEDYFDNSYMDTYTQTCDSLFSDLDFVDIETQTF